MVVTGRGSASRESTGNTFRRKAEVTDEITLEFSLT